MGIAKLTIAPLEILLRSSFKHHSAERRVTQAVIVTAVSQDGLVGKGEGCPREYVTQESIASCLDFFALHQNEFTAWTGIENLERWTEAHQNLIDRNPAAWCAVELALLDLFSKQQFESVEKTLGAPELSGPFFYTAVLGDSLSEVYQAQARRYLAMGFRDFKIKVSGNLDTDSEKIAFLLRESRESRYPAKLRLRLDANNLWQNADEVLNYLDNLPLKPFAIEEPLRAFDYAGLAEITQRTPTKIILDESFLNGTHFKEIQDAGLEMSAIVNIRVSKMGGLRRSLEVAAEAQRRGIPIIIGAQVGETSILSRAALTVANSCRENLLAQEGAYGTLLLERDITSNPVMFGKEGRLDPHGILEPTCYGLQIRYDG